MADPDYHEKHLRRYQRMARRTKCPAARSSGGFLGVGDCVWLVALIIATPIIAWRRFWAQRKHPGAIPVTPGDRWPCADWCCTAGCTSDGPPGQPCDCGAPGGKGPGRCTCGNAEIRATAVERDHLSAILGELWLYVDWRYCTKQLTTEQKEAWAAAVEAWQLDLHKDDPRALAELTPADRWWLCPTCGVSIHHGPDDGPHEGCMHANDAKGAIRAQS